MQSWLWRNQTPTTLWLHLLDSGASEPVLSDRAMDMDADLYEYFTAVIERAFASDDGKNCRFLPDSAFAQEMAQNGDFVDLSRRIGGVIFEQLLQYPAIQRLGICQGYVQRFHGELLRRYIRCLLLLRRNKTHLQQPAFRFGFPFYIL